MLALNLHCMGKRQSRWCRIAGGFAVFCTALVGLCILTWIKERECDPVVRDYEAASFANKARSFLQHERITKATKLVAFFLSSRGPIRCNSIRDTVQTQHKHIPRQRNGDYPRNSEP
jgi:hypothetical protein